MTSFPHRFITIEGNIGTGKTTVCKLLAKENNLKLVLESFADNPFLPFFYDNAERYAFPVELFFMTERHKQLSENVIQSDLFQQTVLADYFFLKTVLFAKNNLNKNEFRLFQRLFKILNDTFPKPDLLIYIHRPVEVLLKNIKARNRSYEQNITATYLESLQNAYFEYFKMEQDIPILILESHDINLDKGTPQYNQLLSLMQTEHAKGVQHIKLNALPLG